MPDLGAPSRSLYVLSQDKNDPNTNPEIISRSRKDIFVDISWVPAKKNFFFFFFAHSSFQSSAKNVAKIVRVSSEMTKIWPSSQVQLWEGDGATSAPHLGTVTSIPGTHTAFRKRKGKQQCAFFQRSKKRDDFKARLAVYIYYCDLKVNTLRRGF